MTVKELVSKLRAAVQTSIENNYFICSTFNDSKAMELFSEREVRDYFPSNKGYALVINIKGEDGE